MSAALLLAAGFAAGLIVAGIFQTHRRARELRGTHGLDPCSAAAAAELERCLLKVGRARGEALGLPEAEWRRQYVEEPLEDLRRQWRHEPIWRHMMPAFGVQMQQIADTVVSHTPAELQALARRGRGAAGLN